MMYYIVGVDTQLFDAGLSSEPDLAIIARFDNLEDAESFLLGCSSDLKFISYRIVTSFI